MHSRADSDGVLIEGSKSTLEQRAEIASLEELHTARRQLLLTLAPLKALHGPGNLWDSKRKRLLEALKVRQRLGLMEKNVKVTDGAIEAMAYADEQYERFLDEGERARIDYINQQNELDEIVEKIKDRENSLYAYSAEARLGH